MKLSLRAKGQLTFIALALYVIALGFILGHERQTLLRLAVELEQLNVEESKLNKAANAIDHSMLRIQRILHADDPGNSSGEDLALDVELIQAGLQGLQARLPEFDDQIADLGEKTRGLRLETSRSQLIALQESELAIDKRLDALEAGMRDHRKTLWESYYRVYDKMTLLAVAINLVGALLFGTVIMLFFRRLTWDLRKLGRRATEIVSGYRGRLLDVTRQDEVGDLMQAVNRLQVELRQREQKLEVGREQHFHREKMAAIGSLAAAVAHEINNPLAAIIGIVQSLRSSQIEGSADRYKLWQDELQLVLDHAQRLSAISRQISEFTRPRESKSELLDLNALVRSTCRFVGYDPRLRGVSLALELDNEVPAVNAVADHLTQVLMNVMINAADALEGVAERSPTIRVTTQPAGNEVKLRVIDNGHGIEANTITRVFDESFSTKPDERGRGIGLFLCKELLAREGGRIEMESAPGSGTTVTIHLPSPGSESS